MNKATPMQRLKNTLSKIQSLTKSTYSEYNKRPASAKEVNYEVFKKSAIKHEFIRVYFPASGNMHVQSNFAIAVDEGMLSLIVTKKEHRKEDVTKVTTPMAFDAFNTTLKSFLKDLTLNPTDWLALLHKHFITPELDNTQLMKKRKAAYIEKQKLLRSELEIISKDLESTSEICNAKRTEYLQRTQNSAEQDLVNDLEPKLQAAKIALIENNKKISKELDLEAHNQKSKSLQTKAEEYKRQINWELEP
jgi:hypothetical protein